jgi:nitroreductase
MMRIHYTLSWLQNPSYQKGRDMNEISRIIKTRRSVRSYLAKQITTEELKTVLEAGVFAPSSMNTQPWFFSVLQNPELIARVNDWIIEEAAYVRDNPKAREIASTKNAALFRKAPTVIIVSGERANPMAVENCSCAAQNMMLAAASLGLGSCWISYVGFLAKRDINEERYRAELRIPSGYAPLFGLTIGYPASPPEPAQPRRKGVFAVLV